jgi:hypothetical protein
MDKSAYPGVPEWYNPSITYEYDDDFRKWVRYRNVVTGTEGVAYVAPDAPPANAMRLVDIRQQALAAGQNVVTLPLFPRLPTGGLIYHGTPQ